MIRLLVVLVIIVAGGLGCYLLWPREVATLTIPAVITETIQKVEQKKEIELKELPVSKIILSDYHIYQSFNNCGPAALSMALSYYGVNQTQQKLGQELRPYQVVGGDNDDKSVTLEELAEKSKEYDLIPYHRPNGNIETVKQFINYDLPVITRTWLKVNDDIGHYRVIKGYDDNTGEIIQDDSLQGKNLRYSYDEFGAIWGKFNNEYLVLVPADKKEIVESILNGEDQKTAWQNSVKNLEQKLKQNPNDTDTRFNLSVAYYNAGDYQRSVDEFEKVEDLLSFRTLWYQIEPIEGYYQLGNYQRVFQITDKILNNQNRAFSELYVLRGKSYQKQGKNTEAKSEFEKAVLYNKNLTAAKQALESLD